MYDKDIVVKKDKTLGYEYFIDRDHPLANKSVGKVYMHRHVASIREGRWVGKDEVVHHMDGIRDNNNPDNLEILSGSEHAAHHLRETMLSMGKQPKAVAEVECMTCDVVFPAKTTQQKFCSLECARIGSRKVDRPSAERLKEDTESMSWLAIGKKYGVSDNAARKWARSYGISWKVRKRKRSQWE